MARRNPYCGNCGTAYSSEGDQYCRGCGQSVQFTGATPRSATTRWSWRFLLVIPAFVVGYIVPGMLVRISTELGSLIPGASILFSPMAEVGQGMADGACAVLFSRAIAPHSKMGVSFAAAIFVTVLPILGLGYALLSNYYAGVGLGTVVWQVVLHVIPILAAWVAVMYARVLANRAYA